MSRSARRDNSSEASLFPFLAVLLCTMGALVTLLVVMATVSRKLAEREQAAAVAAAEQLREDAEEDASRREMMVELEEYRDEIAEYQQGVDERVARQQEIMHVVEDHIRRLQQRLAELRPVARELESLEQEHVDDRAQAERELARLRELADDYREQLAEAKANAEKPTTYAILPYEGAAGTHRRPIYIECRRDKVILQPEGIELTAEDFHPMLWTGSPLVAAIRAAQYFYEHETPDPADRPYPILIVRPGGVGSYRTATRALSTWDAERGYEVVGDDWELDFGPPNPDLAERKSLAIDSARAHQAVVANSAPGAYERLAIHSFDEEIRKPQVIPSRRRMAMRGTGSQLLNGTGFGPLSAVVGSPIGHQSGGSPGRAGVTESTGDDWSLADQSIGDPAELDGGANAGQTRQDTGTRDRDGSGDEATANGSADAERSASGGAAGQSGGQAGTAAAPGGTAGASPMSAMAQPGRGQQGGGQDSSSSASGAVRVVRTIRVVVTSEKLLVVPDNVRDLRHLSPVVAASAIDVTPNKTLMLQDLNERLRGHISGWGMAGNGLEWRPRIELTVGPGGEQAAAAVVAAARESGVEISTPHAALKGGPTHAPTTR